MAIAALNTLKNWFKTSFVPTQDQFWSLLDSFRHKLDKVPVADIEGLDTLLTGKASANTLDAFINQKGAANGIVPLDAYFKVLGQYLPIIDDLVTGGANSVASAETVKQLKILFDSVVIDSISVGAVTPEDVGPLPSGKCHGFTFKAGTYPLWGNKVVPANSMALLSSDGVGGFKMSLGSLNFSGVVSNSNLNPVTASEIFRYLYSTEFYQTTFLNENLMLNPDFFNGFNDWTFQTYLDYQLSAKVVVDYANPYGLKVLKITNSLLAVGGSGNTQKTAIRFNQEKTFVAGSKTDLRYFFLSKTDFGSLHIWNVYFIDAAGATISTTSITMVSALVSDGWYSNTSPNISIPALAVKCRLEFITRAYEPQFSGVPGSIQDYFTAFYAHFSTAIPAWKNIYGKYILDFLSTSSAFSGSIIDKINANKYAKLIGKKVTSYGDSITHNNNWQPYIVTESGVIHTKRGAPGCTIVSNGTQAYFNADGSWAADGSGGATQKYQSMCHQNRVDTIPLDTEVLIIMGGTNDFSQNMPLGTILDTGNTTFYGAYFDMLYKIFLRIPSAEIIIATPIHKDLELTVPNSLGNYMEDYRVAIRKTAFRMKYKLAEMSLSGINQFNIYAYSSDGIHPTSLGGARMAKPFLEVLNTIY